MTSTADDIAARILALPEVEHVEAGEELGAPEVSWGDRFFFVGPDRRRPFATIVHRDVPGFDEDSHVNRPGVFRLNIQLGGDGFERQFGYRPTELADRRQGIDFTALDEVLPHPAYGRQGWACVLNPGAGRLADLDRLIADAHRRAFDQHERMSARHRGSD